ncbi:amidohydrolase [Rhodococcus tibetensis]|uniref:Amidohydrolase n=1 Tax=Rhodococcus tibetensis TaxID=2965064 RepID=A0ABT1QFU3_9NOCA|nr:amidohydrolase [Rhodococcus sp. FXJ9.536]MCQ4119950.1 amidohydrolase [Rhodococcus sp. FXJ9.536]
MGTNDEKAADLVLFGDVVTMNDRQPRAQAVAVRDGRIAAVGNDAVVFPLIGPTTATVDVHRACIMPGFVEAHGHPLNSAVLLGEPVVDIRPVTVADADTVVDTVRRAVGEHPEGVVFNGWDPLLQKGLPAPTRNWLNSVAPETSMVILHNTGHVAYFNDVAAREAGLTRKTPDPEGGSFGRDSSGELDGSAFEAPAVMAVAANVLAGATARLPELLAAECARMNAVGVTTVSEMAFDPRFSAALTAIARSGALTTRLRLYEMSNSQRATAVSPGVGNDLLRQVGIKIWSDGSPWVGNAATSFPYIDSEVTRSLGLAGTRGKANYTADEVYDISRPYFEKGWQISCHANGDDAVTMVLDAWERMLAEVPREDHRLRLEHVGAMRPDQFRRATELGVTCSMFVDHLYYWGDVLVDDLFGAERGSHWAAAASAIAAGQRISFHNDGPVTPTNPLRNIADAVTRRTRSGRVLAPEERIPVLEALRAETVNSAWHLHSEDAIGSITPGKHADLVVLSANPLRVDPEDIADLEVLATILEGRTVFGKLE